MKNPRQYRDSIMFTIISYVGAIIVVLITIMVSCTETTQKQHNFQVGELTAQDSLELKEPDKRGINRWTPVYPDECVMWVSSNGDTIWE